MLVREEVVLIQKTWRMYHSRKKVKNLFVGLPEELQKKILFYVQESSLIEKYHYVPIRKIIDNRWDDAKVRIITLVEIAQTWINNTANNPLIEANVLNALINYIHILVKYFNVLTPKFKSKVIRNKISVPLLNYIIVNRELTNICLWRTLMCKNEELMVQFHGAYNVDIYGRDYITFWN